MIKRRWVLLLMIGFIILPAAFAAENKEKVKISGISRVWGDTDKKVTFMEGKLIIVQEETTIRTGFAEVDQEKKDASFSKGVQLTKKDLTISSRDLMMNFNRKKGTFVSQVRLERSESRDKQGKVTKDALTLTCEQLEADTKKENFIAVGQVKLIHKEFTGTSQTVEFDNEKQIMIMVGEAVLVRDKGEQLFGQRIIINLESKTFEVRDGAAMEFNVDKDDEAKVGDEEKNGKETKSS